MHLEFGYCIHVEISSDQLSVKEAHKKGLT